MENFKKRCKLFENLSRNDITKIKSSTNYSLCHSFNYDSNINKNTKLVIVGTLTPKKGRAVGYFYSSPTNRMFEILDSYFLSKNQQSNLKTIKSQLIKNPHDKNVIQQLKNELHKHQIALLDVIDYTVASDLTASDDEIIKFNLDYKTFETIKNRNIIFVCNSRNAEFALNIISNKLNKNFQIDFAPQIWRKSKQAIQQRWNDILSKYL